MTARTRAEVIESRETGELACLLWEAKGYRPSAAEGSSGWLAQGRRARHTAHLIAAQAATAILLREDGNPGYSCAGLGPAAAAAAAAAMLSLRSSRMASLSSTRGASSRGSMRSNSVTKRRKWR